MKGRQILLVLSLLAFLTCAVVFIPQDWSFDKRYGITFLCVQGKKDCWKSEYKAYVRAGVEKVAERLGRRWIQPVTAFRTVYGITTTDPMVFLIGTCKPRDGWGGCMDDNGIGRGSFTWGARLIEFYEGAPFMVDFPDDNRTAEDVREYNIHTVIHELGHAFSHRFHSLAPYHPYRLTSKQLFSDNRSFLSSRGFAPSPNPVSIRGYWRPNNDISTPETFANMFLGYIYDTWADDMYGAERRLFMDVSMRNLWLSRLLNDPYIML